jgi:protein-tyrosine phosphatase
MSAGILKPPMPNSYWVVSGQFAAGEYPGALDESEARGKLRMLLQAGITRFIDLTEARELSPYVHLLNEVAGELGLSVRHDSHAIVDGAIPSSRKAMAAALDAIDAAMDEGHAVYVHCLGGIGRTGTVVGCWLVRHGRTGDEALAQVAELFGGMAKAHLHPRSPETAEQEEYARHWSEPTQ